MVHDDRTYLDDEGLEYGAAGHRPPEVEAEDVLAPEPGERLWGTHERFGGYDAE